MAEAMRRLRILHVLSRGLRGGAQSLIRDITLRSRHDNVLCTWHTSGPLNDELEAKGHTTIDLSGVAFPAVIRRLEEEVAAGKYDVVVNHGYEGKQAIIFAHGEFDNCTVVQYLHSCYDARFARHRWAQPFLRRYTKRAYAKANATVAISQCVLDDHRANFGRLVNPHVLYNGIDDDRFRRIADVCRPLNSPMEILYLGRLIEEKGVQNLISACAILRDAGIAFNLTIAGWGDREEELMGLAKSLDVNVRFMGETDKPEECYASADVFVHSPIRQEGFGITLVEAMASGCICVASDIGGIPEIITDGRDGYLVEAGNPKALAERLAEVSKATADEILAIREAAANRARDFSLDGFVERFDAMMEELTCNA